MALRDGAKHLLASGRPNALVAVARRAGARLRGASRPSLRRHRADLCRRAGRGRRDQRSAGLVARIACRRRQPRTRPGRSRGIRTARPAAVAPIRLRKRLARRSQPGRAALFDAMDFRFLFDPDRGLFSIGYRVADGALDAGYYDLLASEARLTSLIAIAKGDVPATHWFRLGRALTPVGDGAALLSWSGSMFEYLMPSLVMYTPRAQPARPDLPARGARARSSMAPSAACPGASPSRPTTCATAPIPTSTRPSACPGSASSAGLEEELVIAPYATALAAMYDRQRRRWRTSRRSTRRRPAASTVSTNPSISRRTRLPESGRPAVVQAYMAHHQGMIAGRAGQCAPRRRHAPPLPSRAAGAARPSCCCRSARRARCRRAGAQRASQRELREARGAAGHRAASTRRAAPALAPTCFPTGRYAVMLTAAGSGYSRWGELAVTRWREDATLRRLGQLLCTCATPRAAVWSAAYQPVCAEPDAYEAVFLGRPGADSSAATARCPLRWNSLVSTEDDAEIRRLSLTQHGHARTRDRDHVLRGGGARAAGGRHRAPGVLQPFRAERISRRKSQALLAMRRPRQATRSRAVGGARRGNPSRGAPSSTRRTAPASSAAAATCASRSPWSTAGRCPIRWDRYSIPIFSLRHAGADCAGRNRPAWRSPPWSRTRARRSSGWPTSTTTRSPSSACPRLPGRRPRSSCTTWALRPTRRICSSTLPTACSVPRSADARARRDPAPQRPQRAALWRARHLRRPADRPVARRRCGGARIVWQLLRAHEYWRSKRLAVDLVILNERRLPTARTCRRSSSAMVQRQPGIAGSPPDRAASYVLRADLMTREEADLLACARASRSARAHGSLAEQVTRMRAHAAGSGARRSRATADELKRRCAVEVPSSSSSTASAGSRPDGTEYVVVLGPGQRTPAPWINVIANAALRFQVSESGAGYTWSLNSRENQFTPWSNDPVSDPCGEAIYIRDEDSGESGARPLRPSASSRPLHRPPRPGLQPLRHGRARHRLRPAAIRRWDDPSGFPG